MYFRTHLHTPRHKQALKVSLQPVKVLSQRNITNVLKLRSNFMRIIVYCSNCGIFLWYIRTVSFCAPWRWAQMVWWPYKQIHRWEQGAIIFIIVRYLHKETKCSQVAVVDVGSHRIFRFVVYLAPCKNDLVSPIMFVLYGTGTQQSPAVCELLHFFRCESA